MKHNKKGNKKDASKGAHHGLVRAPAPGLSAKQQKRDLKRAAKAAAAVGSQAAAATPGSHLSSLLTSNPTPMTISAYKRPNIHPNPFYPNLETALRRPGFLTPNDKQFKDVMTRCYKGLVVEDEACYSGDFHQRFTAALRGLESNTRFLKFDITQPGGLGTKIAKTYVSRCVVGEPGITYKYLGLRLFAYPWAAGEEGATPETVEIGRLNRELVGHTSRLLNARSTDEYPYHGSCEYNLTLINRCFPTGTIDLKKEPMFEKENCTVSWHADSSLEHFSTIGVYHVSMEDGAAPAGPEPEQWRVSLRVRHDSEGPAAGKFSHANSKTVSSEDAAGSKEEERHPETAMTPPVAVPLPQRCCYYMLDDFNHHHQHSVLVGNTHRFASTHRVCRRDGHTFDSMQSRCKSILQGSGCDVKQIRVEQSMLNELEFEWIRQFYVQGRQHLEVNTWWREPMRQLMDCWRQLEERTLSSMQVLQEAALSILVANGENGFISKKKCSKIKKKTEKVELECYDVLLEYLKLREEKRKGWAQRCREKMYRKAPPEEQPLSPPLTFRADGGLPSAESVHKQLIGTTNTSEGPSGGSSAAVPSSSGRVDDAAPADSSQHASPLPYSLNVLADALTICRDHFLA